GTFNNWCGGCAPMTDANSDNIWEIIIPLPADTFEYKFANDNWAGQESLTSGSSCTITTDGFTNRQIIVTENIVLPAVCWGSCDPCINGFEMLNANNIDIYPNPAQGQLNIALNQQVSEKLNLRVMDASGRVVFSSINTPAQKLSVDTKNLANGVYFLQVSSNEIQVSKSFIVQN
ncbi:MAG TPA: T9SS type A sorting domain-containing protein, partial [Flavobacteriales bacterium]|nr:T9SS type A sorting domain-containing protein [Flavobacteriales bacterium]